jgi:tetratricopeptide (TPR) repeat protein
MRVSICAVLMAILGVTFPVKAEDAFHQPLIQEIQALHEKSEKGDKQATRELVERLEGLHKEKPTNSLIQAYLGSAYTLASRDAFPGPKKMEHLKVGLKTMDKAVESDPENIPTRFIRAVNNYNLPTFINRRDNAREDFEILLSQIKKKPDQLNPLTNQAIYYYAGLSFKQLSRKDEARSAWEDGLRLDQQSDIGLKIADEFKKIRK